MIALLHLLFLKIGLAMESVGSFIVTSGDIILSGDSGPGGVGTLIAPGDVSI